MDKAKEKSTPFFIIAVIFFLVLQWGFYCFKLNTSLKGAELIDTDTYMRLVRVEQLVETGDWYDSTIYRNNYPYGDTLHWTRPLDVLLIAGGAPLIPWLGLKDALLKFGIVFSPIIGIFSLLALIWTTKPVMSKKTQNLLLLIFIAQPLLFQIFMFGRPDHHSLLVLLFILLVGSLTHMFTKTNWEKYSILAGFFAAISTWISTEAIFSVIMVYLALVFLWVLNKEKYTLMLREFSFSLLIFTSLFLLIERPVTDFISAVEYDKISIVYVFVYFTGAVYSLFLSRINSKNTKTRLMWAIILLIPAAAAIWLVYPLFFHGPMVLVNPDIVPIWLSKVSEVQPLHRSGYYFLVTYLGSAGLVLFYGFYLWKKKEYKQISKPLLLYFIGFLIFSALTFYQVRMAYCGLVLITIVLAFMLNNVIAWITKFPSSLLPLWRSGVILLFILGFPLLGMALTISLAEESNDESPPLPALCQYLNDYSQTEPDVETVLAPIDYGPQILYRTDYNIISAPYHRNDSGMLFTEEVMTSNDMGKIEEMLKKRKIDLIVIPLQINEFDTIDNPSVFFERLKRNQVPDWLTKLKLPEELEDTTAIYRVNSDRV